MFYGFNLIGVDLYSSISDQISQEFTSPYPKNTLPCIEAQLMLPKHFKHPLKILYIPYFLLAFYYHVVNIHLNCTPYFIPQHSRHHPLVHGPDVFQPKRHHSIMIIGFWGDECCLFSVLDCQGNLMIPLRGVQETHPWVSVCSIYQLIDLWHRKRILWACSVQIREIYTKMRLMGWASLGLIIYL